MSYRVITTALPDARITHLASTIKTANSQNFFSTAKHMNDQPSNASTDAQNAGAMTAKVQAKMFDDVQISELAFVIAGAPPPPKKMKTADVLSALAPQLLDAMKRGHNTESLAELLQGQGLRVTQRTIAKLLRKVLTDAGASARARAPKKPAN